MVQGNGGSTPKDPGSGMASEDALKAVRQAQKEAPEPSPSAPEPAPRMPAWQRYLVLALAAAVIGSVAGYFYARTDPRAAAGAIVADFLVDDPIAEGASGEPADEDAVVPSSGSRDGRVLCGFVDEAISNDDHLASLAAGVVVVRFGGALDDDGVEALEGLVSDRDRMLVAPEPRLVDNAIEAVAWGKRLPLPRVNLELLQAFHRANEGLGPNPRSCPG